MITIPPGQVTLSDRRTQRSWTVQLAPYQLAAYPITQALYTQTTDQHPSTTQGDRLPLHNISWWDAVKFCNALSQRHGPTPAYHLQADGEGIEWDTTADGHRLPTEAEWEHACRTGTTGPRYGPLDETAWHRGNSNERIREVGRKQPNPLGLHDMLGNVWEWCWDLYDPEVHGNYRVLRGGGWYDEHWSCRASEQRRSHPTPHINDVEPHTTHTNPHHPALTSPRHRLQRQQAGPRPGNPHTTGPPPTPTAQPTQQTVQRCRASTRSAPGYRSRPLGAGWGRWPRRAGRPGPEALATGAGRVSGTRRQGVRSPLRGCR